MLPEDEVLCIDRGIERCFDRPMSSLRENHSYETSLRYKQNVLRTKEFLLKSCILNSRLEVNESKYLNSQKNISPNRTLALISQFQADHSKKVSEGDPVDTEPKKITSEPIKKEESRLTAAQQRYESILLKASSLLCRIKNLESDVAINSLKLKVRVEINKKIGQISCSSSQVRKISFDLTMLLNECWRKYGHDFLLYCLYVFAEKVVDQAEKLLGIHFESSYPYAAVTSSMIKEFSDLEIILAHVIYSRCPLAIPLHLNEIADLSGDSGLRKLINFEENETLEEFLERTSGVISLLGAIFCMSGT